MKYTNYLINGKFIDPEQIIVRDNIIYQAITTILGIIVAIIGLGICTTALPITVTVDGLLIMEKKTMRMYNWSVTFFNVQRINRQDNREVQFKSRIRN